jgi:hypothetical protein
MVVIVVVIPDRRFVEHNMPIVIPIGYDCIVVIACAVIVAIAVPTVVSWPHSPPALEPHSYSMVRFYVDCSYD